MTNFSRKQELAAEGRHLKAASTRMPYVQDIAVLDYIFLAFQPQRTLGARRRFRSRFQQAVPTNRFRANEVMLKIGVDGTRRLRSLRTGRNRPCATLIFSCSKETDQFPPSRR